MIDPNDFDDAENAVTSELEPTDMPPEVETDEEDEEEEED